MRRWLRKLRGLAGVGVTWGVSWGAIGAGIGWVLGRLSPELWLWSNPVIDWAIGMGLYGAVSGVGFGGLLSLREGRKKLRELGLGRVALWGVLGSAAVPLLFGALGAFPSGTTVLDVLGAMGVTGLLGGTFASGAVAVARRAELREAEERGLLEAP